MVMAWTRWSSVFSWAAGSLMFAACGAAAQGAGPAALEQEVEPSPDDPSGIVVEGSSSGTSGGEGSSGIADPTWAFDVNRVPDFAGEICDVLEIDAAPNRVPTDLVIAVDGSGSMVEEAAAVEARLNDVVAGLEDAGVDTRVVLLARASGSTGICIDVPVGSGTCPNDGNEPGYRHLDVEIGSWEPLRALVDHFPAYADMLRPGARRQLLVVSDDNAFDLGADGFVSEFEALDPWNERLVFHAVVTQGSCPQGVSEGTEYVALAERSAGTIGDLCSGDFASLFAALTVGASQASTSCVYPLDTVAGWPADEGRVSLEIDGIGVDPVVSAQGCDPQEHGWFVDPATDPTTLQLCPASCDMLLSMESPRLDATVSCGLVAE